MAAAWRWAGGSEARAVTVEARTGWQEKGGQICKIWGQMGGGLAWVAPYSVETGLEKMIRDDFIDVFSLKFCVYVWWHLIDL